MLVNPKGSNEPPYNPRRVVRGGGWLNNEPAWARATTRRWGNPWFRNAFVGFRCARDAMP
jgi:formylglycine-generating enzyme required for sulfatase activity